MKNWANQVSNYCDAQEYEAWGWLEQEGWGLVAIEPPDPIKPGICKYYFERQRMQPSASTGSTAVRTAGSMRTVENFERRRR